MSQYCSVDDIKRILRILENTGDNQQKVRFSDSYELPEAFSSNSGTGVLSGITTIKSDYAGSEYWWILFTSETEFTLYRGEGSDVSDGTGSTDANFTSTSGIIAINLTEWSGTPSVGDKFKFRTTSNISEDDASSFIEDASDLIDGRLQKEIDDSNVPFMGVTPTLITKAAMYISSSIIFSSIFAATSTENAPPLIRRWYNFGMDFVSTYLDSIPGRESFKYLRKGRFVAREPLFHTVGVAEAAGVEGKQGIIDIKNMEYDKDYNTKEDLGPS